MTSGVFIDRSFKHVQTWAVVWRAELLPVRFGTAGEARQHLYDLDHGGVSPAPRLPPGAPVGKTLQPPPRIHDHG